MQGRLSVYLSMMNVLPRLWQRGGVLIAVPSLKVWQREDWGQQNPIELPDGLRGDL